MDEENHRRIFEAQPCRLPPESHAVHLFPMLDLRRMEDVTLEPDALEILPS